MYITVLLPLIPAIFSVVQPEMQTKVSPFMLSTYADKSNPSKTPLRAYYNVYPFSHPP